MHGNTILEEGCPDIHTDGHSWGVNPRGELLFMEARSFALLPSARRVVDCRAATEIFVSKVFSMQEKRLEP